MIFEFHVLWQPKAREEFVLKNGPTVPLPVELWWKVLSPSFSPKGPLDETSAKEFADNLALDQECNVHVYSSLTPGDLWYHSYADGRKGRGWPFDPDPGVGTND